MFGDTCMPTATEKAHLAPCLGVPQFLRMRWPCPRQDRGSQ